MISEDKFPEPLEKGILEQKMEFKHLKTPLLDMTPQIYRSLISYPKRSV